ncbi:hypothetical protein STEG23_031039, partial [Scotinomys teguina]
MLTLSRTQEQKCLLIAVYTAASPASGKQDESGGIASKAKILWPTSALPSGASTVLDSHVPVMTPATLSPRGWTDGLQEEEEFKNFFACMMNDIILEIYDLPKSYLACTLLAFTLIIHTAFKYWFMHKKILSLESANQDLQNRLLNLESANLMQELQSINNKCIAKIGFVDNKYEYLMDRTLTLQSEVVTTQTLCKKERLSLTDKIRSLESCVSEEHKRWYDSMKNLESLAREEVHSLEQTLCARLQALEETLCKHDKEPNKQKGILMQREDVILEWIFLPCKPNKKLKTYIEKISDLIHK